MRRLLLILMLFCIGCSREEELPIPEDVVSWETLLSNVWKLAPQPFTSSTLFASSTGPVVQTGYAPKTIGDLDHGIFQEVKEIAGGYEAVLAEAHGAGAITWIQSANPVGELVVEIDGRTFVYSFSSFLTGDWLPCKTPFASITALGYNLHFPILHREYCKLSLRVKNREELGSLFYQVAWNGLEAEKPIEVFDAARIAENRAMLKQISNHWKKRPDSRFEMKVSRNIFPGQGQTILTSIGRNRFHALEITARSKKELASLWFDIYWDFEEEPSVSCPLHMLCGVSPAFEDVDSIPITVNRARVIIRWPMAFNETAQFHLRNTGDKEVVAGVGVAGAPVRSVSEKFCATFATHRALSASQPNLIGLADVRADGRIVGSVMHVEFSGTGWWGEGDPLIYLDASDVPAWHGTGTEDYFGFSWCSTARFMHPLRSQTRAGTLARYHLLDTLPFRESAWFTFEAHGMGEGLMDYSTLALWYEVIPEINSEIVSE